MTTHPFQSNVSFEMFKSFFVHDVFQKKFKIKTWNVVCLYIYRLSSDIRPGINIRYFLLKPDLIQIFKKNKKNKKIEINKKRKKSILTCLKLNTNLKSALKLDYLLWRFWGLKIFGKFWFSAPGLEKSLKLKATSSRNNS